MSLRELKKAIQNRPQLGKVYGAPSINADRDLVEVIEHYNRLLEHSKEVEGVFSELQQQLKDLLKEAPRLLTGDGEGLTVNFGSFEETYKAVSDSAQFIEKLEKLVGVGEEK